MSERLSRERLDTIIRMIVSARGPKVADEIADHIAALEAEAERLRGELKHQGSVLSRMVDLWESSSPPTTRPDWLRSALAALDEEVGE